MFIFEDVHFTLRPSNLLCRRQLLTACLSWAVLGLHCCVGSSPVVASGGCSPVAVCRLLTVVASYVALWLLWLKGVKASVCAVSGL